ncbi:MAG: DUF3575 domain-containing protein [Mediterranea sp.]|jgi:hypothetical protein|nr:DUF3575 domain-containing protein [Mediterranea sp.]
MKTVFCTIICVLLSLSLPALAEGIPIRLQGVKVWYFPINGTSLLRHYQQNSVMFDALDSLLSLPNVKYQIDSIHVTAAASPIASTVYNKRLSATRTEALKSYLWQKHPTLLREHITTHVMGIDWDGFRAIVERKKNLPARADILRLLASGEAPDKILQKLRTLGGAKTRRFLMDSIYPRLQYVTLRIRLKDNTWISAVKRSPLRALLQQQETGIPPIDTLPPLTAPIPPLFRPAPLPPLPQPAPPVIRRPKRFFPLTLKTNLLYDALCVPNLGLELNMGAGRALTLEGGLGWWRFGGGKEYYRIQYVGMEARQAFSGGRHAIGIHVRYGTYDIRLFPRNDQSIGWLSNGSLSAGATYTFIYKLPHNRRLDFSLGAGYLGGPYHTYVYCKDDKRWEWNARKSRAYWGVTHAGISLVQTFYIRRR